MQGRPRIAAIEESEIASDIRRLLGSLRRRRPPVKTLLSLACHPVLETPHQSWKHWVRCGQKELEDLDTQRLTHYPGRSGKYAKSEVADLEVELDARDTLSEFQKVSVVAR